MSTLADLLYTVQKATSWAWMNTAEELWTYPVQGVQPAAESDEALQQSQWPFR